MLHPSDGEAWICSKSGPFLVVLGVGKFRPWGSDMKQGPMCELIRLLHNHKSVDIRSKQKVDRMIFNGGPREEEEEDSRAVQATKVLFVGGQVRPNANQGLCDSGRRF